MTTRQEFKGKLPYTLRTTSTITVFDPWRAKEGLEPFARSRPAEGGRG